MSKDLYEVTYTRKQITSVFVKAIDVATASFLASEELFLADWTDIDTPTRVMIRSIRLEEGDA